MSPRHLRETFALVRFAHTLFALPFACIGMLLAADGLPPARVVGWILAAMVGARTTAMAFNRIVDRHFDAANPRTSGRSLPAGRLTVTWAWGVCAAGTVLLLVAAWRLQPLALALAPLALLILCGYSLTKRFTDWTHLVLGLALAGAPLGAWIAVRGGVATEPLLLAAAVLLWTAGFDIPYACQDTEADRAAGLHSLPARWGPERALRAARLFHLGSVALFAAAGLAGGRGWPWFAGVAGAAMLLALEHRLVSARDLSRLDLAFFRLNVAVGLLLLIATAIETTGRG